MIRRAANVSILYPDVPVLGRGAEFDDSLAVGLEVGRRLGTRMFNTLAGIGPLRDLAADRLSTAARAAVTEGRTILVEPLSGVEDYPITTAQHAFALVGTIAGRNAGAGVLGDLYHLAVNGENVGTLIATRGQDLAHVQIADSPGRGAPGTGSLPLDQWVATLEQVGYEGWVALEHLPG